MKATPTPGADRAGSRAPLERIVGLVLVVAFVAVSVFVSLPRGTPATDALVKEAGGTAPSDHQQAPSPAERLRRQCGVILAAGLTLIIYSFLYRDNALFKIVENLYVGIGLGYGAIMTWYLSLKPEVVDPFLRAADRGDLLDAVRLRSVPILLGCMLVTRISKRFSWPSRYAYALMIGWGAGIGIPITVHTFVLKQLEAAIRPIGLQGLAEAWSSAGMFSTAFWSALAAPAGVLLILVGTVSVLYYFFFSVERGPLGRAVSKIGVIFLMISFGASFGYTVMGRISLLIDRVQFLLTVWLGVAR